MAEYHIQEAVEKVIEGTFSIGGAAKAYSIPSSTLHNRVVKDPRYEAAKASGKIKSISWDTKELDPENVRAMEEVQTILREGLSYGAAARRFGGAPMKWRRLIEKADPEYAASRARGKAAGSSTEEGESSVAELHEKVNDLSSQIAALQALYGQLATELQLLKNSQVGRLTT